MALASKLVPKYLNNEVNYLSESGQARWNIYLKGTGLNNNAPPEITVNGVSHLSLYGRGLTMVVWDTSMNILSTTAYDIYGDDAARVSLATSLTSLTGDKIFALVSYDAIDTNSTLDAAMTTMKSQLWNTKYPLLRTLTGGVRFPYACIGTTRLGIVSEQMWADGASSPRATLTWAFENWNSAGNTGYGPIFSRVAETSGTGYPFFSTGDLKSFLNPAVGEHIRITAEVKLTKEAIDAGGFVGVYIYTSPWIWSNAVYSSSLEWQKIEFDTSFNSNYPNIYVAIYHMPSGQGLGTSYCRNVQVQKVGFEPASSTVRSKMGPAVITSPKFIESTQKFNPGIPDTYYNLWNSDKNLLKNVTTYSNNLTGVGTTNETVRWFDKDLTSQNEKFIMWKTTSDTSGENMYQGSAAVQIDPTKMYYGAVWYRTFYKNTGHIYVGTHTYDSSDNMIGTRDQNGDYNDDNSLGLNPYFVYPYANNVTKNKWNLVDCWFLPSTFSQPEALDFYNKYWQKTYPKYNNPGTGNPTGNNGNCQVVWLENNVNKVMLRFLDFYNGTDTTKTWWALPLLVEVTPMTISNYEMSSWHLKEV